MRRIPTHISLFAFALFVSLCPLQTARAEFDDVAGTWTYAITNTRVGGIMCEGRDVSGRASITATEDKLYFVFETGLSCEPPGVCVLEGKCRGAVCDFESLVNLDDLGTYSKTTVNLTIQSDGLAKGSGSVVSGRKGDPGCVWEFTLTLTR